MGMPYSKINVGDVFESPMRWTGSDIVYTVTDKADGLVEIRSSYQHPSLPETMWKRPSNRIFNRRIYCANAQISGGIPRPVERLVGTGGGE